MTTRTGSMPTDRPERYARQLAGHWSRRGTVTDEDGAVVLRWHDGQVIVMRPAAGVLELEVSVPGGSDVDAFADVVARHLERFGQRDELHVTWHRPAPAADPG